MKKIGKRTFALLAILTVIGLSVLAAYDITASSNSGSMNIVVAAREKKDMLPSPEIPTLEELGLTFHKYIYPGDESHDASIYVFVPTLEKAYQLQAEQTIFQYENKCYRILNYWVDEGDQFFTEKYQRLIIGMGTFAITWIAIGGVYFSQRKGIRITMKKMVTIVMICLIIASAFLFLLGVSGVSASPENEPKWSEPDPSLPEEVNKNQTKLNLKGNYSIEYSEQPQSSSRVANSMIEAFSETGKVEASSEEGEEEGPHPVYVLVFADEEERATERWLKLAGWIIPVKYTWKEWAGMQIERSDETLVSEFGIDLRILGYLPCDSDDSLDSAYDLWDELQQETQSYLGTWYDGEYWDNYVDLIICITAQGYKENIGGLATSAWGIDYGIRFILMKWQNYWADDNLAKHEVSHLFYAPDHYDTCCTMAKHKHGYIVYWEDALWIVMADVPCHLTCFHWCTTGINCENIMATYESLYDNNSYKLVIRHGKLAAPGGTFSPGPGIYTYASPTTVTVSITSTNPRYEFDGWWVNGAYKFKTTSIQVFVDGNPTRGDTAAAYFEALSVGGVAIPVNFLLISLKLLAPYIALASVISIAIVSAVYIKHRKKH